MYQVAYLHCGYRYVRVWQMCVLILPSGTTGAIAQSSWEVLTS